MINKERRFFWSFLISLSAIALIGYGIALYSLILTSNELALWSKELCLEETCVEKWLKQTASSLTIAKSTSDLLVAFATTGGIIIALLSYLSSINNAALTNHISHYTIFQNYISNEISKRRRIDQGSVDTFLWYNLIFSESRKGRIAISSVYIQTVQSLGNCIAESNSQASHAIDGSFRYTEHQKRIISEMSNFGITIQRQPRNDFYEIEDQLISLVVSVNTSFCFSDKLPTLAKRIYV